MPGEVGHGQQEFNAASQWLSSAPSAASLSNEIKLELYGLFKYVNNGTRPDGSRPSMFSPTQRAKYDAWAAQYAKFSPAGQQGQEGLLLARQRYIEIAKQIGWPGYSDDMDDEEEVDLENLDAEPPSKNSRRADNPIGGVKVSIMSGEDQEPGTANPLHEAVSKNELSEVERIVKEADRSNINAKDEYGYTPLHIAADRGHVEITKLLLRLGANKDVQDEDEQTPILLAEISGRDDIVAILQTS